MIFIEILISAIHVRKRKIIIVANVVATDVLSYKKREPVKTELFISSGKLNISTFLLFSSHKPYLSKKMLD